MAKSSVIIDIYVSETGTKAHLLVSQVAAIGTSQRSLVSFNPAESLKSYAFVKFPQSLEFAEVT